MQHSQNKIIQSRDQSPLMYNTTTTTVRGEVNATSPGLEQDYAHISRYLPLQLQSRQSHSCNKVVEVHRSLSQIPSFNPSNLNQHQAFTPRNLNNVFLEQSIEGTPASKGTHLALESSFCEQLIRDKVDIELVKKEALDLHK